MSEGCGRKIGEFDCCSVVEGDARLFLPTIPSTDLLVTDIPYGEVNRPSNGLRQLDKGVADIPTIPLNELSRLLVKAGAASTYVFCGTEQVSEIRAMFVSAGLSTRLCIWEKSNPSPMNGQYIWLSSIECCVFGKRPKAVFNEHCQSSVWKAPVCRGKLHPTMKPLVLMERLVAASSNEGDVVLDPFCGSGSTLVAAKKLGRHFMGIEIEPKYVEIARQRLAQVPFAADIESTNEKSLDTSSVLE